MRTNRIPRFLALPLLYGISLGGIGFVCGFFGPVLLNPSANQGPLLGIFISGPIGCLIGAVIGLFAAALHFQRGAIIVTLFGSAIALAAYTLYASLPEDRWQGFIIDAEVHSCRHPEGDVDKRVAAAPWYSPRNGWKSDIPRMLKTDHGVVLTLVVHRRRDIYEQRKPWNHGYLRATPWRSLEAQEDYFARASDSSCGAYPIGYPMICSPVYEVGDVTPPNTLGAFLGLYTLRPVPDRFREFIR